jgi:hypothetical protein
MMTKSNYKCETPVVLIIFNRPNETRINIGAISKVQPNKLYVISDGPRNFSNSDLNNVNECRSIVENLNWDCEVIKIYSEANLGCMRRVVTGLNKVFENEEKAIILEDDCIPSIDFFKFCEWGLNTFDSNIEIGLVSGSNLLANQVLEESRNGFSRYINIWGWATWKNRWALYDPFLTIMDVQQNLNKNQILSLVERIFWKEVIKLAIFSSNIWDFRFQYIFFKFNLKSVYPSRSLIENIGFGNSATHTKMKAPDYVMKNLPNSDDSILGLEPKLDSIVNKYRDQLYIKTLWNFNIVSIIKVKLMNIVRFLK